MKEELFEFEYTPGVKGVIQLATSPGGKPCVEMKIDDQQWILLGSMEKRDAYEQGVYLSQIQIESRTSFPFDWRRSIREEQLIPITSEIGNPEVVGVYIPSDKFDNFVDHAMRVSKSAE